MLYVINCLRNIWSGWRWCYSYRWGRWCFTRHPAISRIIIVDSCLVRNLLISHAIFYFSWDD